MGIKETLFSKEKKKFFFWELTGFLFFMPLGVVCQGEMCYAFLVGKRRRGFIKRENVKAVFFKNLLFYEN